MPRGPGTFSLSTFPLSRIHIATTAPRRNLFGRALERGSRPSCRDLISRAETISANPAPAIERLRAAGPVIEVRFPIVGRVWITTTQGRRTHQRARNGGNGLLAAWRRLGDNNAPDQWQFTKPRFVRRDVDLDGVRLRKGEKIMAMLAAANMDPEANEHPERLDLKRQPNRHLAFGAGIHFCLGHQLARIEGKCALQALLGRWPELELGVAASQIRWRERPGLRAIESLPVVTHHR